MSESILQEIYTIADRIINQSIKSKEGIYWKTLNSDNDYSIDETIYNGNSGIILFLLEAYKISDNPIYLTHAINGSKWIHSYCKSTSRKNISLFTGRMGVVFTFLSLWEETQDVKYKHMALEIAKQCIYKEGADFNKTIDLLNGASGVLLGYIHLYNKTREKWIAKEIETYLGLIIRSCELGEVGVFWDKSIQQIKGLCSFSHGASGVAYVLDILAHASNNKAIHWLANQAYTYEDHYFNKNELNWPDYRKGAQKVDILRESIKKYKAGNISFFFEESFMMAWCHGAPGIGFARMNSYKLYKEKSNLIKIQQILKSIHRVKTDIYAHLTYPANYTVCHGLAGIYGLSIEGYLLFDDESLLSEAKEIAMSALTSHGKFGYYLNGFPKSLSEDLSLFMGQAGIGLYYINVLYPSSSLKILNIGGKVSDDIKEPIINLSFVDMTYISKNILEKNFSTIYSSNNSYKLTYSLPEKLSAKRTLKMIKDSIKNEPNKVLHFKYQLEAKKILLDVKIPSYILMYMHVVINQELLLTLNDSTLLEKKFIFNPHYELVALKGIHTSKKIHLMIYFDVSICRMSQFELDASEYELLKAFKKECMSTIQISSLNSTIPLSIFILKLRKFLSKGFIILDAYTSNTN